MSNSLPSPQRAHEALRNAGRRGTSIVFAVMITVLLVALIFAANENDIIGWILVVIAGGWLLLATVVVTAFSRSAKKFGQAVDSARADVAAQRGPNSGGTAVVDEDTHTRHLKLDHSFKIVQVQTRVIQQELAKDQEADTEMVDRALETLEITAHNGRDMLAEHVGRKTKNRDQHDDGQGETIEGDVVR
ncbi:hypothetical protein [Nesterenkonia haasae]|uniref:hypothetical protein n=1 Tax=Nesterenkonia haasae TaxID=2587813 RepID=UPI00192ED0F7|nr:hypothetical protein [Nesterenkonia haasae]